MTCCTRLEIAPKCHCARLLDERVLALCMRLRESIAALEQATELLEKLTLATTPD